MKTIRQQLIERLYNEFELIVDPNFLVSFRRNGYGIELISWSTIFQKPIVQSKLTMTQVVKAPRIKMKQEHDVIMIDLRLE